MTEKQWIALACTVIALQVFLAVWWLPQKWQACQKLYNSTPAQIICLSSNG